MPVIIVLSRCIGIYSSAKFDQHIYWKFRIGIFKFFNINGDCMLIQRYKAVGIAPFTLLVMIFSRTLATSYYFYVLHKKEKGF